jgi:hypothetical protein
LGAERGSYEFALKPGPKGTLKVDLGAGRIVTFGKLAKRAAVPADLAGTYVSSDCAAVWRITRDGQGLDDGGRRTADLRRRAVYRARPRCRHGGGRITG